MTVENLFILFTTCQAAGHAQEIIVQAGQNHKQGREMQENLKKVSIQCTEIILFYDGTTLSATFSI